MNKSAGVGIVGVGKYLPKNCVSNETLVERLQITPEWIEQRTGIRSRHFAKNDESASAFAIHAAREALETAHLRSTDLDLIIGCTSSRDYIFPPLAVNVQNVLGAKKAGAFDLTAGATGFQIALSLTHSHLNTHPEHQHILIVGSALLSRYLNWVDQNTVIIFGDGAGAAIVSRVPDRYGVLSSEIFCEGSVYETLRLRGGGSSYPLPQSAHDASAHYIEMEGQKVAQHFLKCQPKVIENALKKINLKSGDVDMFIFHQANLRMIHALLDKMNVDKSKTFTNVETVGNTADASIPIALCDAVNQKRIRHDDLVVIAGAGPGGTYGASVLRWYQTK